MTEMRQLSPPVRTQGCNRRLCPSPSLSNCPEGPPQVNSTRSLLQMQPGGSLATTLPCPPVETLQSAFCGQPGHWQSEWHCAGWSSVPHRRGPASPTPASETLPTFKLHSLAENWRDPDLMTPIDFSEPGEMLQVAGESIDFLLDTASTFSVLTSH